MRIGQSFDPKSRPWGCVLSVALCRSGLAGKPATTTAYPTCCSGSRATIRDGANGERHLPATGRRSVNPPAAELPRAALRQRLRAARRDLSESERRSAERRIRRRLARLSALRRARRIAIYLAADGEPDLASAAADALGRGQRIYAPVLERNTLRFARIDDDTPLRENRFGILEPATPDRIRPRDLDVVLTPLVAFDPWGTRIGMGGGYYDRCLAFLNLRSCWLRPKLIGLGYEFQRLQGIGRQTWDVPLWAAVTEQGTYRFGV